MLSCPNCGDEDLRKLVHWRVMLICQTCGHRWKLPRRDAESIPEADADSHHLSRSERLNRSFKAPMNMLQVLSWICVFLLGLPTIAWTLHFYGLSGERSFGLTLLVGFALHWVLRTKTPRDDLLGHCAGCGYRVRDARCCPECGRMQVSEADET